MSVFSNNRYLGDMGQGTGDKQREKIENYFCSIPSCTWEGNFLVSYAFQYNLLYMLFSERKVKLL